ncbi:MAG: AMP-binding protein, partial [Acidimicrobiia bacterium]
LGSVRLWVAIEDGTEAAQIPGVEVEAYEALMDKGSPERAFDSRNGDELYLLYTGGTTGMPKGVMWRQEDVFFALGGGIDPFTKTPVPSPTHHAENVATAVALGGGGVRLFPIAPLMHGAGQFGVFTALFQGNAVTLIDKFDADRVWQIIEEDAVNVLNITGDAMARPLADALEAGDYNTSTILTVSSTAAIFSPPVKEQFLRLLPDTMILDAIGSSESGMNGIRLVTKETKPQEGVTRVDAAKDAVVIDENYQPVEPGSGQIGRLARLGNIPIGYYNDPEKTAETFPVVNGVRYSIPGDFARIEADGQITLLGRGSQSINSGGEKIYPEEIEGALKSHSGVFDALVVGVPDDRWGQRVVAVIQARPGVKPQQEELAEHCRTLVAGYKVPRQILYVNEIVRAASGKPDYPWATGVAREATANNTESTILIS